MRYLYCFFAAIQRRQCIFYYVSCVIINEFAIFAFSNSRPTRLFGNGSANFCKGRKR